MAKDLYGYRHNKAWFWFLLAILFGFILTIVLSGCQTWREDRYYIGPREEPKKQTQNYGLTPTEYQAIEKRYPNAFLPALQG